MSYYTQEELIARLLRLEVTVALVIREVVSGSTNPVVGQALMEFTDRIRDEAEPPT